MSLALETICGKFGMKLTDNPATRVVALKIIELAQRGVHDAPTLTEMALVAPAAPVVVAPAVVAPPVVCGAGYRWHPRWRRCVVL